MKYRRRWRRLLQKQLSLLSNSRLLLTSSLPLVCAFKLLTRYSLRHGTINKLAVCSLPGAKVSRKAHVYGVKQLHLHRKVCPVGGWRSEQQRLTCRAVCVAGHCATRSCDSGRLGTSIYWSTLLHWGEYSCETAIQAIYKVTTAV